MNNFWHLVKINFRNTYSLSKQINPKNQKNLAMKKFGMAILFIYLLAYFFAYSFIISKTFIKQLIPLNIPYILPVMFMAIASCFIAISDIFRINGNIFKTKDYDLLNSLPIKSDYIILSKLVTIYLEDMILTSIFMVPLFIVYTMYIKISLMFGIYYFLTMLLIPIIPMIIATIIGTIISYISSLFKKKNLAGLILALLFMLGVFYMNYIISSVKIDKIVSIGVMLTDKFNNIYPLTKLYLHIIKDGNILSLLLYITIPVITMYGYALLMRKYYSKINSKLNSNYAKSNYKVTVLKINTPFKAILFKDIRRFYSSYLYVLNCCMGAIFLIIGVLALLFVGSNGLSKFFETPFIIDLLKTGTPLLIGAFCLMNSTTQCSISIEGKSLKLLKSLPIDPMKIFFSKILTNFTIFIPMIFISATVITIYFKLGIISYLVSLIVPLIYSLFIAMLGIIINLRFPTLEWDNEVRVIKQSLASFITIMLSMFIAILPLVIISTIKHPNINLYTLLISASLLILNYLMYMYLKTRGIKRFNAL